MNKNVFHLKTRHLDLVPSDDSKLYTKPWYINRASDNVNVGRFTFKGNPKGLAVELEITIKQAYRGNDYDFQVLDIVTNWALGKENIHFVEVLALTADKDADALLKRKRYEVDEVLGKYTRYVHARVGLPWYPIAICMCVSGAFAVGFTVHQVGIGLAIGAAMGIAIGAFMSWRGRLRSRNAREEYEAYKKRRK